MVDEPENKPLDLAKGVRLPYYNRVAHMGMMLEKMSRQIRQAERIQTFAATQNPNDLAAPAEEQDMGVNVGNEHHTHIYMGGSPESNGTAQKPIAAPKKNGWLKPALVGAALLGTGAGGSWLANWYFNQPQPPGTTAPDTDTDTITEIDFPQ